ncbi:murein DD-endopeptidase MepM/ murein hydrolase activator NlpD [Agromyces sp. 3263]|uniref:M23 family metallopeptidase n=1 Tax=Agromyces sp. 3263 TaxID=2817750 RepID=UPI0028571C98|nr:M23 family metallopeptidase [Agromyces sp. 3263]MDR6906226.1 murein DD-endopeptidase MepM/ murein hydrolase activator NlpD [Agromyces sp. 3263]
MADVAFSTVWQPGDGTQWVKWGMTDDDFIAADNEYFPQGLRVTSLEFHEGRIAAVWRPGEGTQWVKWGMTDDDFIAADNEYFPQGLRITSFDIADRRIAAVWRPGEGTQWVKWGMTDDDFIAADNEYFPQGLRVTSLEVEDGRIAAVWRPGEGTQWVKWGMSADEFAAADATYFADGLRITSLVVDHGRFAAVWRPGEGTQWWSAGRGAVDFSTEDGAYFARGLRIACLSLHDDPVGAYRYPWRGGDSYTVGQGNNSPAGGSHTGVQAWAFDFDMPAGTEIRAARAGTVEWLQENLTGTFNPTKDVGPDNTPFPDGDLRNWGNAVRLRHAGGFTSWYFHIQNDGVLVAVGDEVRQGQAIARSGNTGRTAGPHLHFQVQADSVNWGPSVPHTFGDACEQPASGATATSDNAP